ncbi:MAG: MBL fold metallo-hydrolase [Patescibacteria group bacterium]
MAYQIDYMAVGDGERSGDAIALRFGNLNGPRSEQVVIIIDGGFKESGEALVEHVKTHYGTDVVDLVILTHPDCDHASGLTVVLEKLTVNRLAMHRPWEHAADIKNSFQNGRISILGLEKKLEESLQYASDIEALAIKKGIPIVEPFQGAAGFENAVQVLGPSREYYESLLPQMITPSSPPSMLEKALTSIQDFFHIDLLDDDEDSTSAANNTSTITLLQVEGHKILFTGDAGKTALNLAADYAESQGIDLKDLHIIHAPHHGSKRNLNSKLLKRVHANHACVSAAKASPKHPSKRITNALHKHGTTVHVTRGQCIMYNKDAPRLGWSDISPEPFHTSFAE